jgi:hypothetical protein
MTNLDNLLNYANNICDSNLDVDMDLNSGMDLDLFVSISTTDCRRKSISQQCLQEWECRGNTIPLCINEGCIRPVSIRSWSKQGIPSLKTECSPCATARFRNIPLCGITYHKKIYCENRYGMLGFICPMDPLRYTEFASNIYHLDHLDGNHLNNISENLKTFCAICHMRKSHECGDYNSNRYSY